PRARWPGPRHGPGSRAEEFSSQRAPTRRLLEKFHRSNRAARLKCVDLEGQIEEVEVEEVAVDPAGAADDVECSRHLTHQITDPVALVDKGSGNGFQAIDRLMHQGPVVG